MSILTQIDDTINDIENLLHDAKEKREHLRALHLKASAQPKKWEPEGGEWVIDASGEPGRMLNPPKLDISAGLCRETERIATRDAAQLRKIQRLLAWRAEDSDEVGEYAPSLVRPGVYRSASSGFADTFGLGLTEEACDRLVALANSGEVVL